MRAIVIAVTLAGVAAPAFADPPPWAPAHGRRAKDAAVYDSRARQAAVYDSRGHYAEPRVIHDESQVWRGNDGRYYCKRSNGTTGLVVGAAVGALVGREIDGGRDRTTGTILGAAGGALLGREIAKGEVRCS
jgi:uncharacterized protein YcfJ